MTGYDRKAGWRPIGQLAWNVRIGLGFTIETWRWVLMHTPMLHVVYLSEVKNVANVQEIMGPQWYVFPHRRPGNFGTVCVVALRLRRFTILTEVFDNIKSAKHERAIVGLVAEDKRTGRKIFFGPMHVDPLGKGFIKANPMARARHIHQVWEWARFVHRFLVTNPINGAVFVGGDVNERMDLEHQVADLKPRYAGRTAVAQLKGAGLTPAAEARHQKKKVRMVEIFGGGRYVKCVQRLQLEIPENIPGAEFLDHELVYSQWAVKKVDHE